MPERAVYKGREGVRRRDEHFREVFGDLVINPVEFIDAGDDIVVTVVSIRGQGGGSG
jgi:signal transduction histidine kinase